MPHLSRSSVGAGGPTAAGWRRPSRGKRPAVTTQRTGTAAEELVARRLQAAGWTILGRRVRAGRAELDLVAEDPGPPRSLVVVEVRWRSRRDFGLPEESMDWRKLGHLRRGLGRLLSDGRLPGGRPLPSCAPRIDLVVVEPSLRSGSSVRIRHHRAVS